MAENNAAARRSDVPHSASPVPVNCHDIPYEVFPVQEETQMQTGSSPLCHCSGSSRNGYPLMFQCSSCCAPLYTPPPRPQAHGQQHSANAFHPRPGAEEVGYGFAPAGHEPLLNAYPPPVHAQHCSATPNRSLAPMPSYECNGLQSAPSTPAPLRKTPPRLPNQKTHHPDIRKPPPEPDPPSAAEDADLRQVDIVIADIAHNVTKCNIDQVFKSVYKLESLALRLEYPAEMIADMKGDISQSAARGQCYGDHIYKMLKNFKSKCAERRESDITQKMVSLLVDNGYGALVTGGDVSPMPLAAFYQYQRIVGPELTVSKPATTPKEDSGFGSEGSVCGGRRGSIVSQESGTGLRMSALHQESSPNGHDATGREERYIFSPNYSAIPESRHGEEDGEPMYEPSYTYIVHQVTPGQK
ncbi:uncharacterized protein LOC135823402 [Sycon ciliatum]|uniref:uncharacterized protein LOC135823402 n=1 Tax=Sycon ciliatum TaxID=27933 RepID=UPI0031F6DF11